MSRRALDHLQRIPLSVVEKAHRMEETRFAQGLSFRDLTHLAPFMDGYAASRGVVLIEEGANDDHLYLLLEGTVEVLKRDLDGEAKVVATVYRGQTFGEMALVDGQPRSATART